MYKKIKYLLIMSMLFSSCALGKNLKPNEAFKVNLHVKQGFHEVSFNLGKDINAYKKQLKVYITTPKKIQITKDLNLPKAKMIKQKEAYNEDFSFKIPFVLIEKYIGKNPYTLKIKWQGCSNSGLCYQPMKLIKKFDALHVDLEEKKQLSQQEGIANSLKSSSFFWVILSFFGFGLLLALTPCVFPMIPILSSIIVSQGGEKMSAKKGFFLSFVYVLSMSVAYTIAGVLAGLFGANIQTAMQNPFVLISFSLVFVALAFSMFGFYDLQMPNFIQSKIDKKTSKQKGILGIAIMGFLSALIVGPCVAAPLAGALIYIGQSGDAFLGGVALFFLSFGMGVPLLLIGASAGKFLPRPGIWMDRIKSFFGVCMLGIAIWMSQRVLSSQISLLLWSFLLIGSAIYTGALEPLKDSSGWRKLLKTCSFLLLVYGILLFIGAFSGGKSLSQPLPKGVSVKSQGQISHVNVSSLSKLDEIIKNSKKPVMIDFWASWCSTCKELDEITFEDEKVKQKLKEFEVVKIDVTNNSQEDKELLRRFNLFGPPALVFFKDKKELKEMEIVGFIKPKDFLEHLGRI